MNGEAIGEDGRTPELSTSNLIGTKKNPAVDFLFKRKGLDAVAKMNIIT